MFGKMFGNIEAQRKEIKEKLSRISVEGQSGDGAVKVVANGNNEITSLSLDATKVNLQDHEALEDLILIAVNRALQAAGELSAAETQKMLEEILPSGLGGLLGK